jgi:hypothetical protein
MSLNGSSSKSTIHGATTQPQKSMYSSLSTAKINTKPETKTPVRSSTNLSRAQLKMGKKRQQQLEILQGSHGE